MSGTRMAGELAVVTGATSGIGKAIAVEFASEGAAVVVHGRDPDRGGAVVERIVAAGGRAAFVAADLADRDETIALLEESADRLGGLTVLVNNAVASTVGRDSAIADMDDGYWEEALRVNLTAPMWLCRAAISHMRRAGHGSIVNVSSRQAERPSRGLAAYAASKGGMNALTRAIAVDHADDNIRCNTISPGFVVNERRDADITAERLERMRRMHLTRLGEARDVAYAAVYLACRESEYLTGINLQLDGGSSNARAAQLG
jgi:NAD(P)-dependent dehydrogenase (short-subunit alcohol dehydrogenase family)